MDPMTFEDLAIARVRSILHGIDFDDSVDDDGWWETSWGVARGKKALNEIEELVRELIRDR